jgi:2-iminoacetate synthase ThiH
MDTMTLRMIREAGLLHLLRGRIDEAVARTLWSHPALHALRGLADATRRKLHGDRVARVRAPSGPGATVLDIGCEDVVAAMVALRDRRHATVIVRDAARQRTALEFLRACALARLVLADVPHIAVSATELLPALLPIALDYGVDQIVNCHEQAASVRKREAVSP